MGTSNNSYRAVSLLVFGVGCLLVVPTVLDVWMAPPEVLPEPPSFVEPLGGVLTAVLGIVITVVAIVVQLAAQRYTPKVVDLFMRDRTTLGTFGFMVVSCIYVVMAPMFTRPEHPLSVPVVLCVLLALANLGVLLPYFRHVFRFLQPTNIINLIEKDAHEALLLGRTTGQARAQAQVADSIERIADTGLTAMLQHDRNLAVDAVYKLDDLISHYLRQKRDLPSDWRTVDRQHFMAASPHVFERIMQEGVWVEVKTLDELTHLGRTAFREMPDLAPQLAVVFRSIAFASLRCNEDASLLWTLRYSFTMLRHAINSGRQRPCFDMLFPLRETAQQLLERREAVVLWMIKRYPEYALAAVGGGLGVVAETLAHDARVVMLDAAERGLDSPPKMAESLVRQIRLIRRLQPDQPHASGVGALLLARAELMDIGDEFPAARAAAEVLDAARLDLPVSLRSAAAEALLASDSPDYWEATYRGQDFRYVPAHLRELIQSEVDAGSSLDEAVESAEVLKRGQQ